MDSHPQKRVLVITDDAEAGELVQAILAGAGFAVGLAGNKEVTVEQIAAGVPELVVVDTLVPLLAEWRILAPLTQLPSPPPILLLSGQCVPPGTLAALTLAISGHLIKPFSAQALISRCERLLATTSEPGPLAGRERRRGPRRRFLGQATLLTSARKPSVAAEVSNISAGGAEIDLGPVPEERFEPGSRVCIALGLPPSFEPLELQMRVEWRRAQAMGVSFGELTPEARKQLDERLRVAFPPTGLPRRDQTG